jgi:hypothetical protein
MNSLNKMKKGSSKSNQSMDRSYTGIQDSALKSLYRIGGVAAGEAIIASDMWNSTAGFMAGILLQGAGVLISIILLRSSNFSRITAYAGILANGFDLAQHLIHPFIPSIASIPGMIAGLSYLIWFPMLGRDFFRLGRLEKKMNVEG